MTDRVLGVRDLNRATLARQMLLDRAAVSVSDAVERLVGLQAQLAVAPFVGLWTRLASFERDDLARALESRAIVKATYVRATLHLVTADDYARFRATLEPMLTEAGKTIAKTRGADFDREKLLAAARAFIAEKPRTFAEISDMVAGLDPAADVGAMRYTVRTHLPLVQVPVTEGWSYPAKPEFALAEEWIGRRIPKQERMRELVLRYLAAFGPASATDMQTWSGMPKLKETFEKLKPELRVYRDEGRRELFDLPDVELPDADAPAPVRFLPEYDNLLLSHSKRTRVVADEHRSRVYLPGLRVAATVLVDGFVRGAWTVEKGKGAAALVVSMFEEVTKRDRAAIEAEGERLVRFVEPKARSFEVRFAEGT
jgi:hypothetical protein